MPFARRPVSSTPRASRSLFLKSRLAEGIGLDQVLSDVQFARSILDISFEPERLTQAEQALKTINEQFDAAIGRARELGLATGLVETARENAVAALLTGFERSIETQILAITDPLEAALQRLAEAQELRLREAEALGADLVAVEALSALERTAVIERFAAQATATLEKLLDELAFGSLSRASPGLALSGDAAARIDLPGLIRSFVDASRAFFASFLVFRPAIVSVRGAA